MKTLFTPTWIINSIYHIKPQDLLDRGFRAAIIDLDNTLLAWDHLDHTPQMKEWIESLLKEGIKVHLLSNNTDERVKRVADPLKLTYTPNALKPMRRNFRIAMEQLNEPAERIVVIGDQIMTDVLGAGRVGMKSILVKPIAHNDIIYSWLNRRLESVVLRSLNIDKQSDWGDTLDD
ncbi:YqeG family HAD IIIA-type phosphatase [Dolosicoccus paucivorans]|uniref:YqeG family HAD IIIA-type phosphatase n=1 Tax=Dolosicoccus paucivorans TaxID=84521 RepID=A0A1G8IV26_9LACT|nr:YqeG family HAD IIIA-type phosphatase [Dolosicoccus paucivorans]PMB84693.1 YqeG family HAD IIIA-type phosphatase [Dolosicoccus paucivorans]PMC59203.1 YqeG family HAD IIIA-type phosphatase [Dolosicoccus paucivorans]SDI22878.1 hypothetical protein SAMN04487994_100241 [Dolosicoccus paucivorans]